MLSMEEKTVALYTKYRPQKFKEVIGQGQITDVLSEALKMGNVAHAYLFVGSRGIGKTSIARILAKEIGTSRDDLYEIDAASNNSVDEIRELNNAVNISPFNSKYKVYILDEVHMLSKSAFNALLKTLEEPPSHVVFILATTEPEKIPDTVVSRCETYIFKKPNQKILKELVEKVTKAEGYSIDSSSADLIALLGDGSFRDTLGVLQKVVRSSKDKKLTIDEVEKVTGAPKSKLINDYIEAIVEKDIEKGIDTITEAVKNNIDMKMYLSLILSKVRALLMIRFVKNFDKKLEDSFSQDDVQFLKKISENNEVKINSDILLILLKAYDQINKSIVPELPLELALIEIVGDDI